MGTEETPVIIEVALTTNTTRNPNTGRTVDEVVEQGLVFVDPGATIFASPGPDGAPEPDGYLYSFNYDAMSYAIDEGMARGMGVHFACFEPGWLRNVLAYWRAGRLSAGSFVRLYFGGDLLATPVARATVEQGGHLRVGLEDHIGDGHPTNLELVQDAVRLCQSVGRPVATPAQTIEILGLPQRRPQGAIR